MYITYLCSRLSLVGVSLMCCAMFGDVWITRVYTGRIVGEPGQLQNRDIFAQV